MRITNNMMTTNLLTNVNKNLERMSKKQNELASGKKIHYASDDPVLAAKVLARRTDLAELDQYDRNTRDALGWIEITEKAIEDNGELMQRIRELTVQAANGTNTAEDTQKIQAEVMSLREQLISNANSTYAGRYIFSGFETDKPLLKPDGSYNIDVDQYSIDNKPIVKYEVGVGESINVMTSGLDIYGTVEEINIMNDTFPSGTAKGTVAVQEKLVGVFDFDVNYTLDNLDVTIAGSNYVVDESTLAGTSGRPLTKDQVLSAYSDATNGNGLLSDVANVYFNAKDELVIESKLSGQMSMSQFSSIYTPVSEQRTDATISMLKGNFDLTQDYSLDTLDVDFDGTIYNVDESLLVATVFTDLTEAEVIAAYENADDGFGGVLSDVADVYYDDNGVFTIESKTAGNINISQASGIFTSFTDIGLNATADRMIGDFDLEVDYSLDTLDVSVSGVSYDVPEAALIGSTLTPLLQADVVTAYENASDGSGGILSDVANIFFDATGKLVIENKSLALESMSQSSGIFTTTLTEAVVKEEAVINNGALPFVDPLLPEDIDILMDNDISIVINGVARKVKPSFDAVITDVASYVAEINLRLDDAFGSDVVDLSVSPPANKLTFTAKNTINSIEPEITIDFPRTHTSQLIADIDELIDNLEIGKHSRIGELLDTLDGHIGNMLSLRADIGARSNRMDLIALRISSNSVSFTSLLSDAEDADMAEVVMELKNAENVYQASLSAGARIIQPSLIDFLR